MRRFISCSCFDGPDRAGTVSPSIVFIHVVLPHYRDGLLSVLVPQLPNDAVILTGGENFDPTLTTDVSSRAGRVTRIENRFLAGRRLMFQRGVMRTGLKARVVVLDLNPRILSSWLLLLARRVTGKRTIVWGHAWPRAGRRSATAPLRRCFRDLADVVVTYTAAEAAELGVGSRRKVFVAPNALYRRVDMVAARRRPSDSFIFVGRLVSEKRVDLAIKAVALLRADGYDAGLSVVGGGPMRKLLELEAAALGITNHITFHGEVHAAEKLRAHYAECVASVCPGTVGLALTQSLGFGVPMVLCSGDGHGPEVAALRAGWNGIMVEDADASSIAEAMRRILESHEQWRARRESIAACCRDEYSAELQAEGLMSAIRVVSEGPRGSEAA